MAIKFNVYDVLAVINVYTSGSAKSWAPAKLVYLDVAHKSECNPNSVRNFIVRHPEVFEIKYGKIRPKPTELHEVSQQLSDEEEFKQWVALRIDLIGETMEFLKTLPMSPTVENLLVAISNAREELKSYTDDKLRNLTMDLSTSYGFVPKCTI